MGETQEQIAAVFAEVLGLDPATVGANASFFDLGGNSLSATRVAARVGEALAAEVSVRDVFEAPTVRELVRVVGVGGAARLPAIVRVEPRPVWVPLMNAQYRMWFINRFDPAMPTYNIPFGLRVGGDLDVYALRAAVVDVMARHEVLRTLFPENDGVPFQKVVPVAEVGALLDYRVVDEYAEVESAANRGFDLVEQLPIRVRVLPVSADEHIVLAVVHHIAGDGQSVHVLMRDLIGAYGARVMGVEPGWSPLAVQVADVALWEDEVLGSATDSGSVLGGELGFWRSALESVPELLALPTDFVRPAVASGRGGQVEFEIPARLADAIAQFARERAATPFMVVHTALALLLSQLAGTADVVVGAPIAGRGRRELDGLVGMFVNTLVLRTEVDPDAKMVELLDHVRKVDLEAFANSHLPFEFLVTELMPVRSEAFAPLVQVLLSVEDGFGEDGVGELFASAEGLTLAPLEVGEAAAKVDLTIVVNTDLPGRAWRGGITYATDLFTETTVAAFAARLVAVLEELTAQPNMAVGAVSVLTDAERAELVPVEAGEGAAPVLLADLFAASVIDAPDAVAVVDGSGQVLTYRELDERSNRLARWLINRGIGPEQVVALLIPRSVPAYTAVWAVAKTGAAYVSVDPDYPAQRVANMLEDSGATLALTVDGVVGSGGFAEALEGFECISVGGAELSAEIAETSGRPVTAAELVSEVAVDNTAYVIYTSGSTGRPKGVAVSHRGLANFAAAQAKGLDVRRGARVLGFASPSFDASVLEYLLAVTARGAVAYRPFDAVGGEPLQRWMVEQRVEYGFLTPSVLATLDPAGLPDVRALMAGGEAVPASVVARWSPFLPLHNVYGPTETTIGVTFSGPMRRESDADGPVLLGGPIAGISLLVLDARLQPVPFGVLGELYVAGLGVSRAYLGRAALTAERFVADPFGAPGERLYRTGDLVRWVRDEHGSPRPEYVGRTDDQVKLRGLRIELGEIQNVVGSLPGVEVAAVIAVGGAVATALAAYVVPRPGVTLDLDVLRELAGQTLAAHMIPASFTVLDALPMTAVGKLDVSALPEPKIELDYTAPASGTEAALAAVFAEVLDLDPGEVSVTASFFDLGGNSLTATRVVSRIGDVLGVSLSVRDVFDARTVRAIGKQVDTSANAHSLPRVSAVDPRPPRVPLSGAQRRMWFLNQFDVGSSAYNVPLPLRLTGGPDPRVVELALRDVAGRHEVLRTVYPSDDRGPFQRVLDVGAVGERLVWHEASSRDELVALAARGFDVSVELPVRGGWFVAVDGALEVVIVVHHIAFDGGSVAPFAADLMTAFAARSEGAVPEFESLPVQYADYALWQADVLGEADDPSGVLGAQLTYWAGQLAGVPEVTDLPMDRMRSSVMDLRASTAHAELGPEVVAGVARLAADRGMTAFMVHHAVLAIAVARLAGVDDVVVGAPIAGRTDPRLEPLVGMFVNTLVLRTPVRGEQSAAEVLDAVAATDLDAFANADVAFEQLVEQVAPVRSTSHSPLFQIALTYASASPGATTMSLDGVGAGGAFGELGLGVEEVDLGGVDAKVDLTVGVEESAEGLRVGFSYATALFDEATVDGIIDVWQRVLSAVIADPDTIVGDITIVDDDDAAATLMGVGVRGGTAPATLWEVLAEQERDPSHAAVVFGEQVLDYVGFEAATNRVARGLISRGVGAGDIVAVAVERSLESVVAVWGVVKSGAAFLPIDPRLPGDRIGFMLADSGASIGITTDAIGGALPDHRWLTVAELTGAEVSGAAVSASELVRVPRVDDLAYLIFTSGSTGRPKAVGVTHAGVSGLIGELAELTGPQTDPGSVRVLHVASPSFDAAVFEMVWAFGLGATLVVAPADAVAGDGLSRVIADHGVTDLVVTPSVLATVDPGACGSVRRLTTAGEACGPELVERFGGLPGVEMFNLYGPSEATVWATAGRAVPGTHVTIGRPIDGFTARVLDARLHPVPRGVAGELYLSGAGLARGYLGRPGLTAGSFVADPFGATGARMYATGDVVRINGAGDLEYLGRSDDQVKVRGLRIELGEVEAALAAAPGVVYAVATVAEGPGGSQHVVGYVSSAGGPAVDVDAVKAAVGQSLPTYMVPTVWVVVEEFVFNTAGKLDRRALPAPDFSALAADYVAPEGAGELVVAAVFAQVLGVAPDQVSATASFFECGGNSLSAVQVCSQLREHTGRPFELTWMFADPTVRGVAAMIADGGPAAAPSWLTDVLITLKPDGEFPPVFCIHPAGGLAWFFGGLAPFLPDRAVYGLQDPHVVAGEDGPASIAGLAARYIEEIRTLRPEGPYHLLGWSLGGMIAQEMAVQLREAGLDVGVVGLMDAAPLTGEDLSADAAAEATDYAELLGTWRDFFDLEQMEADAEATGDDVLELIRAQLRSAALIPDEVVDRVVRSFEGVGDIGSGHRSRHYDGDLLVFTAAADKDDPAALSDSWRGLTGGEVVNHDIDVAHLEMSDTAALAVIGPMLADALHRADGDGDS
ncbi:MAG TPA: amino acid adenylation domain-containing protein [Gordonia sp. (in: high G+C Gram-positive bacteria)]|nr:amino acid adenylation domain-containing protein [Gordonia sp. (in: high G+C Gram-positive bacteria)]